MIDIEAVRSAKVFDSVHEYLHAMVRRAPAGLTLEFGVWTGDSLNILCSVRDHVWGFDSFVGLPEEWRLSDTGNVREKGHFAVPGWKKRPWPRNSTLVEGYFCDTLPMWVEHNAGTIGFLHIDSDLYSSARDVLWTLNDRIVPGTLIAFDELCDWTPNVYPNWRDHEWKALNEWLKTFDRRVQPIARTNAFQATLEVTQ